MSCLRAADGDDRENVLTCLPQSLCTWDFRVLGAAEGAAELTFNFFTDQGGILLGQTLFTVRKHGPMSGRWTLETEGRVVAEAHKPSAMFRTFEVQAEGLHLTVQAQSAFTRSFEILNHAQCVGTIRPAHAFTRRAFIECGPEIPELAQLFAFWLAALAWKRAAQSNN
jgi:hypothetical protein